MRRRVAPGVDVRARLAADFRESATRYAAAFRATPEEVPGCGWERAEALDRGERVIIHGWQLPAESRPPRDGFFDVWWLEEDGTLTPVDREKDLHATREASLPASAPK